MTKMRRSAHARRTIQSALCFDKSLQLVSHDEPGGTDSCPLDGIDHFLHSLVVVVHNRELNIIDPAAIASKVRVAGDSARVEEKPQGERLMWVEPISGDFIGGNGGRVRLIGNDGTDDNIRNGDWVMLSRTYAAAAAGGATVRPFTAFRWYRIISVEQRATETLLTAPPFALSIRNA